MQAGAGRRRWATLTPSAAFRAVWKVPLAFWRAYRWENGETGGNAGKASGSLLPPATHGCGASDTNMDGLQNVSDEQWVLYGAVETTYRQLQHPAGRAGRLPYQRTGCQRRPSCTITKVVGLRRVSEPVHHAAAGKPRFWTPRLLIPTISELGERIALMQIGGGGAVRGTGLRLPV